MPTLEQLAPWIEAIHHLCQSGSHDEAFRVYLDKLVRDTFHLLSDIGANRVLQSLLASFVDVDSNTVLLSELSVASGCLNWLGNTLADDGRLREAEDRYSQASRYAISSNFEADAFAMWSSVLRTRVLLGDLEGAVSTYTQITNNTACWADKIGPLNEGLIHCNLLTLKAVQDDAPEVESHAQAIKALGVHPFWSAAAGRSFAFEHLRRHGRADEMIDFVKHQHADGNLAVGVSIRVNRSLADVATTNTDKRRHYNAALLAARKTTRRLDLMGTLSARGRFYAQIPEVATARADLEEAFNIAIESGCKLIEAEIRVGLAWLFKAEGRADKARAMAERALTMATEMGYAWARDDANEVLAAL